MSNHSPLSNESIGPSGPEPDRSRDQPDRTPLRSLKGSTQFLSFWIAIALPFIHLPLIVQGLGNPQITLTFIALLAINVLALYVGHGYKR